MVLPHLIYLLFFFFLINVIINFYVFNPSLFQNYIYKTKNILQIIKLKNVSIRNYQFYDVNFTVHL
jgi:hypothetical protein